MGDLTADFSLSDFSCSDGTSVPADYKANVIQLAKNLQILKNEVKKSIHINSSYRTESLNKKVGGSTTSQHLYAKAADITIKAMTPKDVHSKIEELIKKGTLSQGGLGLYNTFVHYDIRGSKSRWNKAK